MALGGPQGECLGRVMVGWVAFLAAIDDGQVCVLESMSRCWQAGWTYEGCGSSRQEWIQ